MKIKKIWHQYRQLILLIFFLLIFSVLAVGVIRKSLSSFDMIIYQFIIQFKTNWLTHFFKVITNFSNSICLLLICLLIIIFIKNKQKSQFVFLNLINIVLLNILLKELFSRPRPFELMLITENGYSFPSGHSMASMAFYGFIIYLICHSNWSKKSKMISNLLLSILILLIGISRIYLGVHYASDVIAGFSISMAYLLIYIYFVEKNKRWEDVKEKI